MRYIAFIILFLTMTVSLSAKKVAGEIIFEDRVVATTFIIPVLAIPHVPDFETLQRRVRYVDANGKRRTLKPKHAKEFSFRWKGQEIRMISKTNLPARLKTLGSKHLFLKLEVDGPLQLFTYFDDLRTTDPNLVNNTNNQITATNNPFFYYDLSTHLVIQKDGKMLQCPKNIGFRKQMLDYLNGCPIVTEQIESKTLKRKHLFEIVDLYNQSCG